MSVPFIMQPIRSVLIRIMCLFLPCLLWTPLCWKLNIGSGWRKGYPPPHTVRVGDLRIIFWGGTSTHLLLHWPERIQAEVLGAQNAAETPDSLGWKRSYAPFVSADGTQTSQVGNQTSPPHSEPQPAPPLGSRGSGLGGRVPYGSGGVANRNKFG